MDINLHPSRRNFDLLVNEYHIVKQQLDSKIQALKILNHELEHCRNERDQLQVIIAQLNTENSSPNGDELKDFATNGLFPDSWKLNGHCDQLLMQRLCQLKEKNRQLQTEVRDLKARQEEAEGDLKTVRAILAKQNSETTDDGGSNWSRSFAPSERELLVKQLETLKTKYMLLEKDLQTVLDEKEELITERDSHKNKVDRLNLELNFALKGDEKRIIDVDAILMENRYLQERLKQTQEEKSLYLQTLSKYRNILEKRRNRSALKFGENGTGSVIITHKQVEHTLQNTNITQLPVTQATVADLRSLALALFESLNDKNIALSHQRKANKTLGLRLSELEKKISSSELPGSWEPSDEVKGCHLGLQPNLDAADASNVSVTADNSSSPIEVEGSSEFCNTSLENLQPPKDSVKTESEVLTSSVELTSIKDTYVEPLCKCERKESVCNSSFLFVNDISAIDFEEDEELPADLQKLVQAAIEDIDKKMLKYSSNPYTP
ncbi:hypothetical protein CHUAL_012711 [Chamberlinius hualienensis]